MSWDMSAVFECVTEPRIQRQTKRVLSQSAQTMALAMQSRAEQNSVRQARTTEDGGEDDAKRGWTRDKTQTPSSSSSLVGGGVRYLRGEA